MTQSSQPPTQPPTQPSRPAGTQPKPARRSRPQALLQFLRQLGGIGVALIPIGLKTLRQLGQWVLVGLQRLYRGWIAGLPRLRNRLPAWNRRIPDWGMTAIAAALLSLLVWLPIGLFWSPADQAASTPADAPAQTQPTVNPARLTAMQSQLTEIADRYQVDLIQAARFNFAAHRLTLMVAETWNLLPPEQREQLSNEWLQRAHKLSFQNLEVQNTKGETLARSPVVGSKMVMFSQSA